MPGFEWDDAKSRANIIKHGVSFEAIDEFDFDTAIEFEDDRFDYGEQRIAAIGWLRGKLHAVTFTWRDDTIRIISLRPATKAEQRRYAKEKT
ncbi:MAG: BrnT family toxin [Rhodomicrobium sp.]|jgi:uncharacterized DUF497 family protein